jgi:thiamine pyrophosphokinase
MDVPLGGAALRPIDVVVLANGDPLPGSLLPGLARAIDVARFTIAADGGLHHAERAGREVDVIVGDLDSVHPAGLDRAIAGGTEVLRHPAEKDATDLALALDLVLERWDGTTAPEVLVVGGHGGRVDHLLANLLLLASERYAGLRIGAWLGMDRVDVVRDTIVIGGSIGATVSLLAAHGPASGVSTRGLRFPLTEATLGPGSSLGVSNELAADEATITIGSGVLLVVRPEPN